MSENDNNENTIDESTQQSTGLRNLSNLLDGSYDYSGDCRRPILSLILNTACFILYSYTIYYQNFDSSQVLLYGKVMETSLQPYGLWLYLTYHSLLMQIASSLLHVIAYYFPKYNLVRDILFTCCAYPIGSLVVYTFWIIWWTQGRQMIFPKYFDAFYPSWLNHVTHTLIVPFNITQCYLTYHKYIKRGCYISLIFISSYGLFTLYVRWRTGLFVYPFMNEMGPISLAIYSMMNLICVFILFETGYFITGLFHLKKLQLHSD